MFRRSIGLSKKLLLIVFLTSSLGTTIASILQLLFEYKTEKELQESRINVFRTSALSGIQESVWTFSNDALSNQLKSSLLNSDFIGIAVYDEKEKLLTQKVSSSVVKSKKTVVFYLKNPKDELEVIGKIALTYTEDFIYQTLWKKSLMIIFTNFLKTLVVASILIRLISYYVTRRLAKLATHITSSTWTARQLDLRSPWPFEKSSDEISLVVDEVNKSGKIIEDYTKSLKDSAYSSARMAELGIFSGGVAHEINNPLAIIAGSIQRIQHQLPQSKESEEIYRSIDRILSAVTRIKKIISSLATLSRDGSNDPFQIVSLKELLDDTLSLSEMNLMKKGITFTSNLKPEGLEFECQIVQISQVLLNLINNSADAIQHHEEKWIRLDVYEDEIRNSVIFEMTDSGKGIPEDIREKIFLPFFTTKEVGKGTGLGLALSQALVQKHGGELYVNTSSINTQFVIRLPKKVLANAA